jgi:hypothetical protein
MTLPGETEYGGSVCEDCGTRLKLQVCHSAAGYYIGTMCDCGPYSRESGYYGSREAAQCALDTEDFTRY